MVIGTRQTRNAEMTNTKAVAIDNRKTRVAAILDTARPFVAVAPRGYLNPIIGHYSTMAGAWQAAKRFNERNAN